MIVLKDLERKIWEVDGEEVEAEVRNCSRDICSGLHKIYFLVVDGAEVIVYGEEGCKEISID